VRFLAPLLNHLNGMQVSSSLAQSYNWNIYINKISLTAKIAGFLAIGLHVAIECTSEWIQNE